MAGNKYLFGPELSGLTSQVQMLVPVLGTLIWFKHVLPSGLEFLFACVCVTLLLEVRSVLNQQDLEASMRCLPKLETRLFLDSPL